MKKECLKCGYCCSYMSDVFGIVENTGEYEYKIAYLITNVQQIVKIDSDKINLFINNTILDKRKMACPFLREYEGGAICTVHETRPDLCRSYFCPKCP